MYVKNQFSKNSLTYNSFNQIQNRVVEQLISTVSNKNKILDLGCGSGALYNNLKYTPSTFTGIDFSEEMLKLHPVSKNINLITCDFDTCNYHEYFKDEQFDIIFSSSALQWSKNFELLIDKILPLSITFNFAIFTCKTFDEMFKFFDIKSPIKCKEYYYRILEKLQPTFYTKKYRLEFGSNQEMLRYIKKSGVSGGMNRVSYIQIKDFINNFSKDYLEFEVLFVSFSKS